MSLDKIIFDMQKVFGKESVGAAIDIVQDKGHYSTGSLQLNAKLSGGFPKGLMTEIYGPEGSGKTTACLHAVADAQSKDHGAVYVDFEGSFDKIYAKSLGIDLKNLILIPPTNAEQGLQIAEKLCKSGEIGILVVDSIATMLPIKQQQAELGDANMALHARLVSDFVKRFVPIMYTNNVAVVLVNQIREKPGVTFGDPSYTPGGNSIKFYAAVRLDIRKSGSVIKDKDGEVIGEPRKIKIIKSKINSSTNDTMMVDISYGEGFDKAGEIVDVGSELGLLEKSGSWYAYNNTKIAQGRESCKQFLKDNPELAKELEDKIIDKLFVKIISEDE